MNFKTLYDLPTEKIHFFNDMLPLAYLFLLLGVINVILNKGNKEPKTLPAGLGFILVSSFVRLLLLGGQFFDIQKAKKINQDGNLFVVEGKPENYHPMPKQGHDSEQFDINGVHFSYSDFILNTAGYHNDASLGGVVAPENYYRLTYYTSHGDLDSNRIIKIEIRQ